MKEEEIHIAKRKIKELQDSYSLAMDSGKYEHFPKIFTEDIEADYGKAGTGSGLDSLINICKSALDPLTSVQHMNGNHWSRINGVEAEAGCYFRVHMTRIGTAGGDHFEMGGKYTDHLIQVNNKWLIDRRRIDLLWSSGNPEVRYPTG